MLSMRREGKMPKTNDDDEAGMRKGTLHHHCFGFRNSHLLPRSLLLHDCDLARKFFLRQGLWTEGLRTPPGQECSNGSLIFFAVVLWRTFFHEIDESEDGAI